MRAFSPLALLSLVAGVALLAPLGACPGRPGGEGEGEGEGEAGEGEGEGEEGEGEEGEGEGDPDPTCPAGAFTWPVETRDVPITPSAATQTSLDLSGESPDPFVHVGFDFTGASVRFAKGTVLVEDPDTVYFQNVNDEPFHGPYARAHLDPFVGLSQVEYDRVSLRAAGQEAILVTLLLPQNPEVREVGIQLVRQEPYHTEQALTILALVKDSVTAQPGTQFFYVPTFEQAVCARDDSDAFAAAGFPVVDADRFVDGDGACYAPGWAIGTLVFVPGADIDAAYAAGTLTADDILVTDAVPAEIPLVAGVISYSASTPASHVALLATQYATPFASALTPAARAPIDALLGERVLYQLGGGCVPEVFDAALLPEAEQARLLALKLVPTLTLPPPQNSGAFVVDVAGLNVLDADRVGGKAAHHSLLLRAAPAQAPAAAAITFDAFDAFMAGLADARAAAFAGIDVDDAGDVAARMAALRTQVAAHRFSATEATALLTALSASFPSTTQKLRFRSSTNVEDGETFTGAGLYDSFSGCLADDLDDDDVGPSLCNAAQAEERGALRAIAKAYAGFFNDNAVRERLRRGVDESRAKMGLLVHVSFDDDIEVANGVAVIDGNGFGARLRLIAQAGALSVTNPEGGATPEEVVVDIFSFSSFVTLERSSSLVPQGAFVMEHDEVAGTGDYLALAAHINAILLAWRDEHGLADADRLVLELEWKKVGGGAFDPPDHLVIKQVRNFPQPAAAAVPRALLQNDVVTDAPLCAFEGESSDIFAIHRAKVRLHLGTAGRVLDDVGAATAFVDDVSLDVADAFAGSGAVVTVAGSFVDVDGAYEFVDVDGGRAVHEFAGSGAVADRRYAVELVDLAPRTIVDAPFVPLSRAVVQLTTTFDAPVTFYGFNDVGAFGFLERASETVRLVPCTLDAADLPGASLAPGRTVTSPDATIVVDPEIYWPPPPSGIAAGYTAPTMAWGTTRITGLIDDEIVLSSPWAQTSRPGHHNFSDDFIFEPRLDPELPVATASALAAADIVALYVSSSTDFYVQGADGAWRAVGTRAP